METLIQHSAPIISQVLPVVLPDRNSCTVHKNFRRSKESDLINEGL
jgi:hypothetical protein